MRNKLNKLKTIKFQDNPILMCIQYVDKTTSLRIGFPTNSGSHRHK